MDQRRFAAKDPIRQSDRSQPQIVLAELANSGLTPVLERIVAYLPGFPRRLSGLIEVCMRDEGHEA